MSDPIASIIIPAYNASKYLGETISSCLAQTVRELEIIVINDGSTDDTSKIAQSFKDPRLQVVDQENGGVASARNHGIGLSRGRYLQFLDADDLLAPNKIEAQVLRFQQVGDIGLGTSRWGRFRGTIDDLEMVPAADWQDLSPADNDLADAALYVFDFAGSTADVASLGLAAASAETGGPTNPVGGALAVGALVANRVSAAFSGLSIPINLAVGNYRGAAANVAGLAVGTWGSKLTAKALGVAPLKGLKNDAASTAAGQAVSRASGC